MRKKPFQGFSFSSLVANPKVKPSILNKKETLCLLFFPQNGFGLPTTMIAHTIAESALDCVNACSKQSKSQRNSAN